MKRWIKCALLLVTASSMMSTAMAQTTTELPANLNWQTMSLLAFNFDHPGYEGTQGERDVAWSIWGSTIEAYPDGAHKGTKPNGNKWPSFIIIKGFESGNTRYIFSSLRAASVAYNDCEDGINGGNEHTPIYTKCPMRLTVENTKTLQSSETTYSDFCNMSINYKDQPKEKNYEQVAVDSETKTAYFRVVQYGKLRPECNRAIRLP